jgi:hypothetical protein
MWRDGHAMAAPVGGANEDGDVGSSRGAWGSIVEYEDRATAGLGGRHSWDGDGEPSSGTVRSAVESTNRNPS